MSKATMFGFALAAALTAAPAAAISVSETTDFSGNINSPTFVGALTPGGNSITGSLSATCEFAGAGGRCGFFSGDDADALSFLIPDGWFLTGALATISNLTTSGSGTPEAVGLPFSGLDPFSTFSAGSFDILDGALLTGAQDYWFVAELNNAAEGDTISYNWRLDLTVGSDAEVIPLPAGLPLMLGGLAVLGLLGRKRRTG
jgi:hypothetical protein